MRAPGEHRPRRGLRITQLASWRTTLRVVRWLVFLAAIAALAYLWPARLGGQSSIVFVSGDSMHPTLDNDDLVLVRSGSSYDIGDVVVITIPEGSAGEGMQVIHRIVGGSDATGWVTRGDNRDYPDPWFLDRSDIVGESRVALPWGTEARVVLSLLQWPVTWAIGAALWGFVVSWRWQTRRQPETEPVDDLWSGV